MRILGIDYGDKRIGLALSDPMEIIAGALGTYNATGDDDADAEYIVETAAKNDVKLIVMGLPKNMDGSEGERATKVCRFGEILEGKSGLKVVYKDERLSSVSANRVLDEANVHWKKRKNVVDTMAAQIILQSYLDIKK